MAQGGITSHVVRMDRAVSNPPQGWIDFLRFSTTAAIEIAHRTQCLATPPTAQRRRDGKWCVAASSGWWSFFAAQNSGDRSRSAGAPGGSRTPDLLVRSQLLCPLSYGRAPAASIAQPASTAARPPHPSSPLVERPLPSLRGGGTSAAACPAPSSWSGTAYGTLHRCGCSHAAPRQHPAHPMRPCHERAGPRAQPCRSVARAQCTAVGAVRSARQRLRTSSTA
jgi:hypothetical protein